MRRWFVETPPAELGALYAKLGALVEDGTLEVDVEKVHPFAQLKNAVAHAAREGCSGKILLQMAAG